MTTTLPVPAQSLTKSQQMQVINLVRRAAKSEIMPRFQNLSSVDIMTKSREDDLVTEADLASEAMISRGLARLFPSALILGEEAVAKNAKLRTVMAEHEFAFVIDPIDGTWNYAKGIPLFGVILSVLRFGTPIFGLLYDPIMDDYIVADETDAATSLARANGRSHNLRTSSVIAPEKMNGYIHFGLMPKEDQAKLAHVLPQFLRTTSLRCSCHEYRILAQGHVEFILSSTLNPWDHAAGILACQKAGGVAAFIGDRAAYNAKQTTGYLLCASSQEAWDVVARIVEPALA